MAVAHPSGGGFTRQLDPRFCFSGHAAPYSACMPQVGLPPGRCCSNNSVTTIDLAVANHSGRAGHPPHRNSQTSPWFWPIAAAASLEPFTSSCSCRHPCCPNFAQAHLAWVAPGAMDCIYLGVADSWAAAASPCFGGSAAVRTAWIELSHRRGDQRVRPSTGSSPAFSVAWPWR